MHALPPISVFEEVSSTNDLAMQAARESAPHGSCWVADTQRGGRGRREVDGERRVWFSPSGVNLYMSLLVKNELPPEHASTITLAAAVGAHDALSEALGAEHDLLIKWPNDLFIGQRKLAGILTEGVLLRGKLDAVVIGVGVNVNLETLPPELGEIATSLKLASGQTYDRLTLAMSMRRRILESVKELTDYGLPAIIARWQPYDQSKGRRVKAMIAGSWREGTSLGISKTGGLLVELGPGDVEDVQTGEVVFLRAEPS